MNQDNKLRAKIKRQITRFTSRLCVGMDKVRRRFVGEMLYGIQASKDIKVAEVARSLNEPIRLVKTENRLCRNLAHTDLTGTINQWTCWEGGGEVEDDTVPAIDLGDVRKPCAKKMEYLGGIHDGSTGEIGKGYWLCEVIAAHPYGDKITPLYGELYAQKAEGFVSENEQILKAIHAVSAAVDKKGIFAIDRGGDRRKILIPLIDNGLRFVIRQSGERHILLPGGKRCLVRRAAQWCRTTSERMIEVEREGYRRKKHLLLGVLSVRLPERPQARLWLVVIRGLAPHPICLVNQRAAPARGRSRGVDCRRLSHAVEV